MNSLPRLTRLSPAKINLFLHIVNRRSDGYHNLQTVFRLLDWGDTIDFQSTPLKFDPYASFDETNKPITISCHTLNNQTPIDIDTKDNLIYKAAVALLTWYYAKGTSPRLPELPTIDINLTKILPIGAGLGGGSSNAATSMLALNRLWQLNLSIDALQDIATKVGADVPIFIFGQDAIGEGIGNILSAIDLSSVRLPQHYLILSPSYQNPSAHASTQALFSNSSLQRNHTLLTKDEIINQRNLFASKLKAPYTNVFEPVVSSLVPDVQTALNYLQPLEALTQSTARLTGSGSSVILPLPAHSIASVKHHIANVQKPPCHAQIARAITNLHLF